MGNIEKHKAQAYALADGCIGFGFSVVVLEAAPSTCCRRGALRHRTYDRLRRPGTGVRKIIDTSIQGGGIGLDASVFLRKARPNDASSMFLICTFQGNSWAQRYAPLD